MSKYQTTYVLALLTIYTFSSCSATQLEQAPVPALLERQSTESRVAIEKTLGVLMNSKPVKLASHAFVDKSTVIIDRNQSVGNQGSLLNGREIRPADTFTLLINDGLCYLKHSQSGNIQLIQFIKCKVK